MLFENKKILITGGYGFVGSHLIKRLDQMSSNVEIICYDKMTYAANFSNLNKKNEKNKYTFIKADICNFDKLFSIAKNVIILLIVLLKVMWTVHLNLHYSS